MKIFSEVDIWSWIVSLIILVIALAILPESILFYIFCFCYILFNVSILINVIKYIISLIKFKKTVRKEIYIKKIVREEIKKFR